jgi:hypothetical protein
MRSWTSTLLSDMSILAWIIRGPCCLSIIKRGVSEVFGGVWCVFRASIIQTMHRASGLLHWAGGFDTCSRFYDLVEWFSRVFLYIGWRLLDIWVGEQIITSNV